MKYKITIEELVSDTFDIEAESGEAAIDKAIKLYNSGEIVLAPGNLEHKQLALVEPESEKTDWIEF